MSTRPNRREFLAAGAALTWAGARAYAAGAPKAGPNEMVNLGLIGCGFRGQQLSKSWLRPGVRISAVCDVYETRMKQARERIGGQKVAAHQDFRKLLENKDVDAVIIATTDHWHALHALHALQAGKDVYVEKPLCTSIQEGRIVVAAAKKYDRVVQFGTWQQSMEHYRKAIEIVRSGRLGAISEVKVWDCDNFYPGFGSPPDSDPPKGLDWDLYLGPAPKVPYNLTRGGYWLTSEMRVEKEGPEGDVIADALFWIGGKGRETKAIAEDSMVSKNDPRNVTLFIEHVRNRTKPVAEGVEVGHDATIPGHLMNIAWRVGRQIRWDAEKEQVIDDVEANALVTKPYRGPWKLDV